MTLDMFHDLVVTSVIRSIADELEDIAAHPQPMAGLGHGRGLHVHELGYRCKHTPLFDIHHGTVLGGQAHGDETLQGLDIMGP